MQSDRKKENTKVNEEEEKQSSGRRKVGLLREAHASSLGQQWDSTAPVASAVAPLLLFDENNL